MFVRSSIAVCLTFILATSALAEIKPRAFTLSPMAGGHIFEGDQNLDNAPFWFVGLGYNLTEKAALEAVYTETDADGDSANDSDAKVRTYRLDALYHFTPEKQLVPYLAVGLGEIYTKYDDGGKRHHLLGNIGGGIKYFLNDTVALRADLRYLLDFPEPKNNLQYSAGFVFQFGAPAPAPKPVAVLRPVPTPKPAPAAIEVPVPTPK
jgi:OmpA-OmpF porin, OOP family